MIEKTSNQNQTFFIWAFKYKFDADEYVKKLKIRFYFKNDLQMINQDTYATTIVARTFCVLMIIVVTFNLNIWQYDVVNAFINNLIDEKTYNECLEDFIILDHCWKLQNVLYDLKQAFIFWYRNFINNWKDLRLMFMLDVNCFYVNDWFILFFYVNDIMIISLKNNANRVRIF